MQDSQSRSSSTEGEPRRLPLNSPADQNELQLMQGTHLLLENLAEREKATVTAILDSLYEVGSVRLINQRVSIKALRGPLKGLASLSKPVFQIFAWRWFRRNCPELITNWLYQQVRFGERSLLLEAVEEEVAPIEVLPSPELPPALAGQLDDSDASLSPIIERQAKEILALRNRITMLSMVVVLLTLVVCFNVFV